MNISNTTSGISDIEVEAELMDPSPVTSHQSVKGPGRPKDLAIKIITKTRTSINEWS